MTGHQDQAFVRAATLDRANTRWIDRALCWADEDGDPWFPEPPYHEGRPRNAERLRYAEDVEWAISICQDCPVKAECLADAERRGERFGVWGGVDFFKPVPHRAKEVA